MGASSISETKRVRYLLGLLSAAERERVESEYFENDDAFQEMLTTEDDLIDAYARGELAGEERRGFEKTFVSRLRGRNRVRFARAFARAVSGSRPVDIKLRGTWLDILKTYQLPGRLQTATIAAVIVFVAVFAWLINDRRRMTNELRGLHAEFAELSKRTEALQRSSDTERTRTAEIAAQPAALRAQPDKPQHRERRTSVSQRVRQLPEVKIDREIASSPPEEAEKHINTQAASLGNTFEINQLAVLGRKFENLISLQPRTLRAGRSDQANITLDGVDVNERRSGSATLRGITTNQNGNAVSGATVTLTDSVRNFSRTQSTNKDGAYIFTAIPPGTYSIKVEASGFKTFSASGLAALVDTPAALDVQLEVGSVSETVSIIAGADARINTSDATIGNSFESRRITELPLNANNVVGLLSLQPGVTCSGFVNGGRADQSSITLDGVAPAICLSSSLNWIRFQLTLESSAIHEDCRLIIKTAGGRAVTSVDWSEPLTPNQTIIDTPFISTAELSSGDYVLLLMGKKPDGSFIKVAEYPFKVINY